MRCIFCKEDSSGSQSVEHIFPESLGNEEHILPPGVVCDKCNNYFAREVEKPLLESHFFVHARFRRLVPSKRGVVPPIKSVLVSSGIVVGVDLGRDSKEGSLSVGPAREMDNQQFINGICGSKTGTLIFPVPNEPHEYTVSRFLGKVALEALAARIMECEGGLDEIIDKKGLDPLRNYARRGSQNLVWPCHRRRIYPEGAGYCDENGEFGEILHEWGFLYANSYELFFVLGVFGIEYVINMGGPDVSSYEAWLRDNENKSPLYPVGCASPQQPVNEKGQGGI